MKEKNEDYLSQFPKSELGDAMRKHVESRHRFYREYIEEDHKHRRISPLSKAMAYAMIKESPYFPFLTNHMIRLTPEGEIEWIMNKGAIRISPCPVLCHMEEVRAKAKEGYKHYQDADRCWYDAYQWNCRGSLWVNNHDGAHWLSQAPVEENEKEEIDI